MKKFLNLVMLFVFIAIGGIAFVGCGEDKIRSIYISTSQENVSMHQGEHDEENKTTHYSIEVVYGTTIDFDKINVKRSMENGGDYVVDKKTDTTNGYTVEGEFPQSQDAGTYTLTYKYEGFTNILTIKIEKQLVSVPYLLNESGQSTSEVKYDGQDYTKRIQYSKDLIEMVGTYEERIEPNVYPDKYEVEFALKDKKNYKWDSTDVQENGNHIFTFIIYEV